MAMLSFDIKQTVAGMQLFNEGRDEGRNEGRNEGKNEGIGLTINKMMEAGMAKNQVAQVASLLGISDISAILNAKPQQIYVTTQYR